MHHAVAAGGRQKQRLAWQEAGLHGGTPNLPPEHLLLPPHVLRTRGCCCSAAANNLQQPQQLAGQP